MLRNLIFKSGGLRVRRFTTEADQKTVLPQCNILISPVCKAKPIIGERRSSQSVSPFRAGRGALCRSSRSLSLRWTSLGATPILCQAVYRSNWCLTVNQSCSHYWAEQQLMLILPYILLSPLSSISQYSQMNSRIIHMSSLSLHDAIFKGPQQITWICNWLWSLISSSAGDAALLLVAFVECAT